MLGRKSQFSGRPTGLEREREQKSSTLRAIGRLREGVLERFKDDPTIDLNTTGLTLGQLGIGPETLATYEKRGSPGTFFPPAFNYKEMINLTPSQFLSLTKEKISALVREIEKRN